MRNGSKLTGVIAALGLLLLAGCKHSPQLVALPDPAEAGTIETVLVATARAPVDGPLIYGSDRALVPQFALFDISVPPDREPSSVRFPGPYPDPQTDFLIASAARLPDSAAFVRAIDRTLAPDPKGDRDGAVFVHGYNTSFAEGLFRHAQIQHDWGFHGASVHFSWPSAARLQYYAYDRESADFSRDALEATIDALARSDARQIDLFAYSMGCYLLMDTLRTMARGGHERVWAKLNSVVLMSPDVEIDLFRLQAPPVLAKGVPIFLMVSDNDRVLALSARIRGERERLGDIRSKAELGNLDVTVLDLSRVKSTDLAGHFREAESPALIAFFQGLQSQGQSLFDRDKTTDALEMGADLIQEGAAIVVAPLAPIAGGQ